jgi:dipeptidyl-peptidase-4
MRLPLLLALPLALAIPGSLRAAGGEDPLPGFIAAYTETNGFTLGRPRVPVATADGKTVLFLRSGPRSRVNDLWVHDLASGEERVLFTAESILQGAEERLSAAELARRERTRQSARGIVSFELSSDDRHVLVPLAGRLFVVERESGFVRELIGSEGFPLDPRFSPDGRQVACVRNGDLYVFDVDTGAERRLTHSANATVSNGEAEFVAQEEMLRREGYWWSPDSRTIACQQSDVAGVDRMHILDIANPQNPPRDWPYPRAGGKNASVRLALIPAAGGDPVWIEWDRERLPYLVTVRWDPNAPLTLVVHDRRQHEARVLAVDAATGKTRTLLVETDPAWVQFEQSVPRWTADGRAFLWSTERGGSWHLELRGRDGRRLRALTPATFGYRALEGIDDVAGVAWVQAWTDPTEKHLFAVRLDGRGAPRRITREPGEHDARCLPGRRVFANEFQGSDGSYRHTLISPHGAPMGELRSVAEVPPVVPHVEWLTLDPPLHMRASVVRPLGFSPDRRYPVLVHVYGGPYVQHVRAVRSRHLLDQWYAEHGYIVVSIDGRGTPGRGRAWERAIDGDLIEVTLADQVRGVRQLGARHREMDLDRVAVYGWSFGGYFASMAVMRQPELFKAGIAGAPVADWKDYDTYYSERYMGLPAENPKGYENANVLTWAGGLERPLMLVHGTADDNVYFLHSMKIADALFRAGKSFEFLPLAEFTHRVIDTEGRLRLYQRMLRFFDEHLKGEAWAP